MSKEEVVDNKAEEQENPEADVAEEEIKAESKIDVPNLPHSIGKHGVFYSTTAHKVTIAHAEYKDELNNVYMKFDNGDPKKGYTAFFKTKTVDYNGDPIYILDLNSENTRYKKMAADKLKEMGYPQLYEEHLKILEARKERAKERSLQDKADFDRIREVEDRMLAADKRRTAEQKKKNKMVMGLGD